MLRILRDRFVRLGRDEDGVALVVTLGVFMFLYVACASVYAIGMAVKEKMHLQGACDAAAYSAAIVQADTFSRIATINRAMSWTYQQMTRRQMDYIVWQWLLETIEHYDEDKTKAEEYVRTETDCPNSEKLHSRGIGWDIGRLSRRGRRWDRDVIEFNGRQTRTRDRVGELCGNGGDSFGSHLRNRDIRASFYSQKRNLLAGGDKEACGLGKQIDDDLRNIRDMSIVVENLARSLPGHVEDVVQGILSANVPAYMKDGVCQYFIKQNDNPLDSDGAYFKKFTNNRHDELVFLSLGNKIYSDPEDEEALGKGANSWFDRDKAEGDVGFHRHYTDLVGEYSPLVANWNWWAIQWQCMWDPVHKRHYDIRADVATDANCDHGHAKCECSGGEQYWMPSRYSTRHLSRSFKSTVRATCRANNDHKDHGYDNRFAGIVDGETVRAKPLKLKREYFGANGTITVGLARRNENPWFSIFGRVTGGMYSAFSPVSDSWTYCFASAKAGYKLYHEPEDWYINAHLGSKYRTWKLDDWEEDLNGNARVENGPRDYCIDWKPEESKFAGWYWDKNDRKEDVLVTEWTIVDDLNPTWRQSWNLVQDDWDAVMVPVRQAGSKAEEVANYSLLEWWQKRLSGQYGKVSDIPYRYEPSWQSSGGSYLATLVKDANWQALSGSEAPNTDVTAGPTEGDSGDVLNGRLAGDIWQDHWRRGVPPPTATGTSQWNIESPGANLDWNQIGDEMYH